MKQKIIKKSKTSYWLEINLDKEGWSRDCVSRTKKGIRHSIKEACKEHKELYEGLKSRYRIVKEVLTIISSGVLNGKT